MNILVRKNSPTQRSKNSPWMLPAMITTPTQSLCDCLLLPQWKAFLLCSPFQYLATIQTCRIKPTYHIAYSIPLRKVSKQHTNTQIPSHKTLILRQVICSSQTSFPLLPLPPSYLPSPTLQNPKQTKKLIYYTPPPSPSSPSLASPFSNPPPRTIRFSSLIFAKLSSVS